MVRELIGHKAGIECMALSADGLTLLSGGETLLFIVQIGFQRRSSDDDALVIVWNLTTGEVTQKIPCVYHGPISAVVWININDSLEPAFVFGCADGTLHLYKRKLGGVQMSYLNVLPSTHIHGLRRPFTISCLWRIFMME